MSFSYFDLTPPKLIALYSSVPGSGKTTASAHLILNYGYRVVPFASTLKNMVSFLLEDLGIEDGYTFIQENKQVPLESALAIDEEIRLELGDLTCRKLCQTLGTDWGRNLIHQDLWILVWKAKAKQLLARGHRICIDDCRFPNEFDAVKQLGGHAWRIHRPNHYVDGSVTAHASEHALDDYEFDFVINNDSSVQDLYKNIDSFLFSLEKK